VDIYYLHRLPSNHDVVGFMTAMKAAVAAGKVRAVGLSEASASKIREAHALHPVKYIQQEWSLMTRNLEDAIVPTCAELGITVVAYSPLSRNLLAGITTEPPADWRASQPRYSPENLARNLRLVADVQAVAQAKNCTAAQLSLKWLFQKAKALGVAVIPIPGTTKLQHAKDNAAAEAITDLTEEEMAKLETIAAAVVGERYEAATLKSGLEGQL